MSTKASKSKTMSANTTPSQQTLDLLHIGAVHYQALKGKPQPLLGPTIPQLIHPDITSPAAYKSQTSPTDPSSRFSSTNISANAQPATHTVSTGGYIPAHQANNPRLAPSPEKNSMQTWRAESAADQPWSALALGRDRARPPPPEKK